MAQGRRIAVYRGNIFFVVISGALGVCIGWILGTHISIASRFIQSEDLPLSPIIQEKESPMTEEKELAARGKGWKNIPIFAGGRDVFFKHEKAPGNSWAGQFGQDVAVSSLLNNKKNGYFVDLAANHPWFLSSTYSLEKQLNWTGLCIEPNSDHWWGISQVRTCQLVGAVIGQRTMEEVSFRVKNIDGVGGHGGIIAKDMDNEQAPAGDAKSFYAVALEEVFQKMKVPHHIDFLSLDVEGAEEFIMKAFPFKDYVVSFINIERVKPGLQSLLVDNGFRMVARLGEDSLFGHMKQ